MAPDESMKKLPTEEDALAFIAKVMQAFDQSNEDDEEKFDQFARALLDFEEQKSNPESLVLELESLFHGHGELLCGFKIFWPEFLRPVIPKELCFGFLNEVRERFLGNPEAYMEFLETSIMYGDHTLRMEPFCRKLVQLLFGHADLLNTFASYVDDDSGKFRQELERRCRFEIDFRLVEINERLYDLRTSIDCVEEALQQKTISEVVEFVEREFSGIEVMRIKRIFPENSDEVLNRWRRNPIGTLDFVLDQLREKEEQAEVELSIALEFSEAML